MRPPLSTYRSRAGLGLQQHVGRCATSDHVRAARDSLSAYPVKVARYGTRTWVKYDTAAASLGVLLLIGGRHSLRSHYERTRHAAHGGCSCGARVLGGRGSCKKCRDGAKLFGVGGRVGEVAFSHLHAARSVCRGHHGWCVVTKGGFTCRVYS